MTTPDEWSRSVLIVGAACLVAVVLKLGFLDAPGPWVFGDELLYRNYAQAIHGGGAYSSQVTIDPAYPPLYPLLLSLAYNVADWYRAMIALNILAGLAIPPLVYAITRWFAGRPAARAAAVVAALVPSGLVLTPLLLAENLSIAVFLMAVWATLRPRAYSNAMAFVAGAAMAAAYLVKYLLLFYIGPLMLGFFLTQWILTERSDRPRRVLIRCMFAGLGFVAGLLPWLAYAHFSGFTIKQALGFGGTVLPILSDSVAFADLGLYFAVVLAAAVLAAAPLSGLLAAFTPDRATERVYVANLLITAAIIVVFNTWFCWKFSHTMNSFYYLPQRYMTYVTWLAIPLAFASAERLAQTISWRRRAAAFSGIAVALLAGLVLLTGMVWSNLPALDVNSPDLWPYALAMTEYRVTPWLILATIAISAAVPFLWARRHPVIAAGVCAVAIFLALDLVAVRSLAKGDTMAKITRDIASLLNTWGATGDKTLLVIDQTTVAYLIDFYAHQMMFWMGDPPIVVSGSIDASDPCHLKILYAWPPFRIGPWKEIEMPSAPATSVVVFSFGTTPPGGEPIFLSGVPGKSFFLLRVPPEQAFRKNAPTSASP